MGQYIAFDAHKRYTWASVEDKKGRRIREARIAHAPGAFQQFLADCEPGSPVAVETVGNWYWIVDEIESMGFIPRLVHARKAKLMMAMVNKTDKLDARGLNGLQRTGTLPTVWIPSSKIRDLRDLPRTRMLLVKQRTQLKNRIHAALARYGIKPPEVSDLFGKKGKILLKELLVQLPSHTAFSTEQLLGDVEALDNQIKAFEQRMRISFKKSPEIECLMTLPGVGFILAVVIGLEIGEVSRFARAEKLASYAGCVPRIHASGGKMRLGPVRSDVNRYLKWAFVEAGNSICRNRRHHSLMHVSRLYNKIAHRKNHQKAILAVGRHLAEATYWMLTKKESYRDPQLQKVSSTEM
jgi:transposase